MPSVRSWFKRAGTSFRRAYATTPLCCPSRASIFTGQYAHNHGVHKNSQGDELPQRRTLQRALWSAGYQTGLAGKYLNGWPLERRPPFFDRWAMQRWGYYKADFNVDGVVQEVPEYSVGFVSDAAIDMLEYFERADSRPWFLYVAPFAAHRPYDTEERYAEAQVGRWRGNPAVREHSLADKPRFLRRRRIEDGEGRLIRTGQLRTLMSVDDLVQRVMSRLKAQGELRDTLAVFTSDNGRSWGEHRIDGKRLPYAESVRIPLILRWPDHFASGGSDHRLVTNLDIPATIWKAARTKRSHALDGFALQTDRRRDRLLLEHWGHFYGGGVPSWASTLTRNYQYVEYYGRHGARKFREYYNLKRDPWQLRNLYGDRRRANNPYGPPHRDRLATDVGCSGDTCP